MLARLDRAFAAQRRFVADASHELRTPLTVMRTAIDVTLAKPGRTQDQLEAMALRVRRSVDRAEAMIEALLTLAVSEQGTARRSEPADLATAADDALEALQPQARQLDLRLRARLEPAATTGDPDLLDRMVANLIGNAIRHNIPGGEVSVVAGTRDGEAFLRIMNTGPWYRRRCCLRCSNRSGGWKAGRPVATGPASAWRLPSPWPACTARRFRPAAARTAASTSRSRCPAGSRDRPGSQVRAPEYGLPGPASAGLSAGMSPDR